MGMNGMRWVMALASLGAAAGCHSAATNPPVSAPVAVTVDVARNRHPIDPRIYGVAFATPAQLADLNAPLHRSGGNNATRYNWKLNADNRGNDWYFESIAEPDATPGARADTFVKESRAADAEPMLTLPMIGWVAKVNAKRDKLPSFSVKKYGAQTATDAQWFPDAGNGVLAATGKPITGNDPADANVPSTPEFQRDWVKHLVAQWGTAAKGGVRYYLLDNEPSIWQSTHRDVFPTGLKLDDLRDRTVAYAAAIKAVDPGALTVGPEEWGWNGYFNSGYDQQWSGIHHDWTNMPDRKAHGGMEALPWLLDQMRKKEAETGTRLLDLFTVHYYPQGGEGGNDTSEAIQRKRNRSTRSLWDPTYKDESWIRDTVRLIPRLKQWVKMYYPGTPIGITEYNWGAENHINGATAQADILGIFGREGLDVAVRWTTPATSTPTFKAMQLFRNYDGHKSGFGETSVYAAAPDPDTLSAFAATRAADGALTLMVVNKAFSGETPLSATLNGFTAASAETWRLTADNRLERASDPTLRDGVLTATLPAPGVTLFVVKSAMTAAPGGANGDGRVNVGDAVLVMRFAVGLAVPSAAQATAADMNGNGAVEVTDAVAILRAILTAPEGSS